jgi:hypothetical protein
MNKLSTLILLFIIITLNSCTAPSTKQLTKDGGVWNIEEMKFMVINKDSSVTDTTFFDCGEVKFNVYQNTDNEYDPSWTTEGYFIEPVPAYINNKLEYVWSTYYFIGSSKTNFLEIGKDMTIWNYQSEKFTVTKNEKDAMEWEHKNWDENLIWNYKLKRKS